MRDVKLNCLWLPPSHGGRRLDPQPGLRLGIRWQRHTDEHAGYYRDIQLGRLDFDPATRQGIAVGRLISAVPAEWVKDGELVELLEGFRVVAIGHVVVTEDEADASPAGRTAARPAVEIDFDFNNARWHDAELRSVYVDRRKPGEADLVQLEVVWPDDAACVIRFHDCYRFECSMNFGVVAVETILDASSTSNGEELEEVRAIWDSMGISLPNLKMYRITTNSTGSDLIIFAVRVTYSTHRG